MAKKYNQEDYDLVQNRIQAFWKDHPDGSIVTDLHEMSTESLAVVKTTIYIGDKLMATGWAKEYRDMELKTTRSGSTYESVNFSSHLENAETSSIGRCLANMGRHGNKRASREEMEAVQRAKVRYESACNAIDERLAQATDIIDFERIALELQNNPKWDTQYNSHLQERHAQFLAKENKEK